MLKKLISICAAAAMLAVYLPAAVFAEGETIAPETVLYENDFSGADISEAFPNYSNDYMSVKGFDKDENGTIKNNTEKYCDLVLDSSGYIYNKNPEAYRNGRSILLNFSKCGGINNGAVKVSYDFKVRNSTADPYLMGANLTSPHEGAIMLGIRNIDKQPNLIVKNEIGNYEVDQSSGPATALTVDKWYTLDIIMDFDKDKTISYYLDGKKLEGASKFWFDKITNITLDVNGFISGLDNLKVSKLNKSGKYTYDIKAKTTDASKGYVDLMFGGVMNTESGSFTIDGTVVPPEKVEWKGLSDVRLYSDAFISKGNHTIVAEVKDIYNVPPAKNSVSFETQEWDSEYIIYENTFDNNDKNSLTWNEGTDYSCGVRLNELEEVSYPVVNGNQGLMVNRGEKNGRAFGVEFSEPLTSGKIKLSFDFMMRESGSKATIGVCVNNYWNGGLGAVFESVKNADDSLNGKVKTRWNADNGIDIADNDCGNNKDFAFDGIHTFDVVINISQENTIMSYYLDGIKLEKTTRSWAKTISNIYFCANDCMSYIDNVKFSWLEEGSFGVKGIGTPVDGRNYIDIYTTEAADADITADKITINGAHPSEVKNLVTGGAQTNDLRYVVRATLSEPVKAGTDYNVELSEDTKNFIGTKVNPGHRKASVTAVGKADLKIENNTVKAVVINDGNDTCELPVIIVASYDDSGVMTSAEIKKDFKVNGEEVQKLGSGKTAELTYDVSGLTGKVKAFMLRDLNSIVPAAPAAER